MSIRIAFLLGMLPLIVDLTARAEDVPPSPSAPPAVEAAEAPPASEAPVPPQDGEEGPTLPAPKGSPDTEANPPAADVAPPEARPEISEAPPQAPAEAEAAESHAQAIAEAVAVLNDPRSAFPKRIDAAGLMLSQMKFDRLAKHLGIPGPIEALNLKAPESEEVIRNVCTLSSGFPVPNSISPEKQILLEVATLLSLRGLNAHYFTSDLDAEGKEITPESEEGQRRNHLAARYVHLATLILGALPTDQQGWVFWSFEQARMPHSLQRPDNVPKDEKEKKRLDEIVKLASDHKANVKETRKTLRGWSQRPWANEGLKDLTEKALEIRLPLNPEEAP